MGENPAAAKLFAIMKLQAAGGYQRATPRVAPKNALADAGHVTADRSPPAAVFWMAGERSAGRAEIRYQFYAG